MFHSCAAQHPVTYSAPQVVFLFTSGVTTALAEAVEGCGLTVLGSHVEVSSDTLRLLDTAPSSANDSTSDIGSTSSGNVDCSRDYLDDVDNISTASSHLQHTETNVDSTTTDVHLTTAFEHSKISGIGKVECDATSETNSCDQSVTGLSIPQTLGANTDFHTNIDSQLYDVGHADTSVVSPRKSQCSQSETSVNTTPPGTESQQTSCSDLILSSQPRLEALMCRVPRVERVNLDVTTLICLVSNLCHGSCNFSFPEDVLTQQAAWERQRPALPSIQHFIQDKVLYVCETALADFRSILGTVGGATERSRAEELIQRLRVTPDVISQRAQRLKVTHQVKDRAKIIFGTGDHLEAVTITANSGFVRASIKQGLSFAVFVHESRALTEQKEGEATTIS